MHDGGAAAWSTVNVCPAIVTVPVRAAPVLALMASDTDPLPVPEAPDLTAIQEAWLDAVHAHALPVVTETVADPALEPVAWVPGLIV